jgi:hypothetical protein
MGNVCPGDSPKQPQISGQYSIVQNNHSVIFGSKSLIDNFIDEEGIEDDLKMSEIMEDILFTRSPLSKCYNIEKDDAEETLYGCSYIKSSASGGFPFYNDNRDPIEECYSQEGENMDNFFCCTHEFSE